MSRPNRGDPIFFPKIKIESPLEANSMAYVTLIYLYLYLTYVYCISPRDFTTAPTVLPAAWVQQGEGRMFWCITIWQLSEMMKEIRRQNVLIRC